MRASFIANRVLYDTFTEITVALQLRRLSVLLPAFYSYYVFAVYRTRRFAKLTACNDLFAFNLVFYLSANVVFFNILPTFWHPLNEFRPLQVYIIHWLTKRASYLYASPNIFSFRGTINFHMFSLFVMQLLNSQPPRRGGGGKVKSTLLFPRCFDGSKTGCYSWVCSHSPGDWSQQRIRRVLPIYSVRRWNLSVLLLVGPQ